MSQKSPVSPNSDLKATAVRAAAELVPALAPMNSARKKSAPTIAKLTRVAATRWNEVAAGVVGLVICGHRIVPRTEGQCRTMQVIGFIQAAQM